MRVAPIVESFPLKPSGATITTPKSATANWIFGTSEAVRVANAIQIAARSDVDQCAIQCSEGEFVVAVGAPLVGEFHGPFVVKPWMRFGTWDEGENFQCENIDDGKAIPKLALSFHPCAPSIPIARRAAAYTRFLRNDYNSVTETNLFGVYVAGRKRTTIQVQGPVAGVNSTLRIYGVRFLAKADGIFDGVQAQTLVLDAAGAKTASLTAAINAKSFTIVDESFDELVVSVTNDANGSYEFHADTEDGP